MTVQKLGGGQTSGVHTGWRVGDVDVDIATARVHLRGAPVVVERSGYDLLRFLLERAGEVATKNELLRAGWPGRVVGENTLAKAIGKLRHAIGDDDGELIRVVHGYGYRLSGEVSMSFARVVPAVDALVTPVAAAPIASAGPAPHARRWPAFALVPGAILLAALMVWAWNLGKPTIDATTPATLATRHALPGEDVVAVLPFRDASPDHSLTMLAGSFSDHLRDHLLRLPGFRAVPSTEVDSYRGDERDFATIARELRANLIVGGDVSRTGNRLHVGLRLYDARGRVPPLEQAFERAPSEQGTLFDDVTAAVTGAISRDQGKGTDNHEAYLAFLQSSVQWSGRKDDAAGERRAIAALEEAVRLDPAYAAAWFELGTLLGAQGSYADTPEQLVAGRERAIAAMDRAIALAPDASNLYARSQFRLFYRYDWQAAMDDVEAAEAITPSRPVALLLLWRAQLAAYLGHLDEAIALDARAVALDPQGGSRRMMGIHYSLQGNCRNARATLQLHLKDVPQDALAHTYIALCDLREGRLDAALQGFERASTADRLAGVAMVEHARGDHAASRNALDALIQRSGDTVALQIAWVYAFQGDKDDAFHWLDRGLRHRDGGMLGIKAFPLLQNLHDDPRFDALLARMNFPTDPAFLARVIGTRPDRRGAAP